MMSHIITFAVLDKDTVILLGGKPQTQRKWWVWWCWFDWKKKKKPEQKKNPGTLQWINNPGKGRSATHRTSKDQDNTLTGLTFLKMQCSNTLLLEPVVHLDHNTMIWPQSIMHRTICRAGGETVLINLWLVRRDWGAAEWLSFNIKETLTFCLLLWNTVYTDTVALLSEGVFNKALHLLLCTIQTDSRADQQGYVWAAKTVVKYRQKYFKQPNGLPLPK